MTDKRICADCGTEYLETEPCCPLCGSTQWTSADEARQSVNAAPAAEPAKKRKGKKPEREVDDGMPRSLVVASTVLVFIAVLALGWHILAQWIPGLPTFGSHDESAPTIVDESTDVNPTDPTESQSTTDDLSCRELSIESKDLAFTEAGQNSVIAVTVEPTGCVDPVSFSTSDATVAAVDEQGKVTAMGDGEADITVTCGIVSKVVHITCKFGAPLVPEVSETTVEFSEIGQSAEVYVRNLTGSESVTWESDDESVATVEDGRITAVGDGVCDITVRVDAQALYVKVKVAREGVVTGRADGYVRIREAASTDADILIQLDPDDKLIILGEEGDWYKVSFNNDGTTIEGYAAKDFVIVDE